MAEQYTYRPTEIEVFPLGSETDVILRKSIAESETTGENGDVATCWQCEERQIRVPGTVSAEDIAADFEAWWEYTPGTKAQSVEDVRTETVAQMSATCNAAIVGGVDVPPPRGAPPPPLCFVFVGRDADRRRNEAFFFDAGRPVEFIELAGACGLWGR